MEAKPQLNNGFFATGQSTAAYGLLIQCSLHDLLLRISESSQHQTSQCPQCTVMSNWLTPIQAIHNHGMKMKKTKHVQESDSWSFMWIFLSLCPKWIIFPGSGSQWRLVSIAAFLVSTNGVISVPPPMNPWCVIINENNQGNCVWKKPFINKQLVSCLRLLLGHFMQVLSSNQVVFTLGLKQRNWVKCAYMRAGGPCSRKFYGDSE